MAPNGDLPNWQIFGWTFPTLHDILLTFFAWLVVYLPLWKIWKSVGMILPNIWKKTMFQTTNQVTIPHARNRALHISFWCPLWLQARTRFLAFQMTRDADAICIEIKGHRWKGWCHRTCDLMLCDLMLRCERILTSCLMLRTVRRFVIFNPKMGSGTSPVVGTSKGYRSADTVERPWNWDHLF